MKPVLIPEQKEIKNPFPYISKYATQYSAADSMIEVFYSAAKPITAEMLNELILEFNDLPIRVWISLGKPTQGEFVLKKLEEMK